MLWPGFRPVPLRWESRVQDIGQRETSWLHIQLNGISSPRDLHLNAKTQLHSTNKQTSVQAQRFNHCLMFLHSGIFCSCCLHFHLSLGPAQGSFRCPKGHDFWVLLFHISMQYVLAKFLDVEFLSKYTAPGGQESSP